MCLIISILCVTQHSWGFKGYFKVISQKLKLPMNIFETFPECSLPNTVSKNTIKMIGHHAHLRELMGQSYSIYACTGTNHTRYSSVQVIFCSSWKLSLLK